MSIKIVLGQEVRDKVSGIKGIAVAKTEFLNGCIRITVQQRPTKKDGSIPPELWFDHDQLEIVGKGVAIKPKPTGGPTGMLAPNQSQRLQ